MKMMKKKNKNKKNHKKIKIQAYKFNFWEPYKIFKNYKTYLYWFFKNDYLLSKRSLFLSFKLSMDSKLGGSIFSFSPSSSIF